MLSRVVVYPFAIIIAALVAWRALARGRPAPQALAGALLALYIGWVISMTFFPLPIRADVIHRLSAGQGFDNNIVPFRVIVQQVDSIMHPDGHHPAFEYVRQLAGNVLVFAPFGILLPLAAPNWGRLRRVLLAGLALSVTIETGQLAVSLVLGYSYRIADVDDVILNLTGVLLGYGLLRLASNARRRFRDDASPRHPSP